MKLLPFTDLDSTKSELKACLRKQVEHIEITGIPGGYMIGELRATVYATMKTITHGPFVRASTRKIDEATLQVTQHQL